MNGNADTDYLVALANSRDGHHGWAMRVSEQVTEPLLACEPVLAETVFHLRNAGLVLENGRSGRALKSFREWCAWARLFGHDLYR